MNKKIILSSVALLALMTGCSSGGSSSSAAVTTDVTVERGPVYEATVTDSSTPAKTATQKAKQNIYTFSGTPTYPVKVTGGWIDVNNDGTMDANDIQLQIQMRSYSNIVTPITTYISDDNETVRDNRLQEILTAANADTTGIAITSEDLLKVPSKAPLKAILSANAIYAEMKENNNIVDISSIQARIGSLVGSVSDVNASSVVIAKELELSVVNSLIASNNATPVTADMITTFIASITTTENTNGNGNTAGDGTGAVSDLTVSNVVIYKNIPSYLASQFQSTGASQAGYKTFSISSTSSCADYGFTGAPIASNTLNGISTVSYYNATTYTSCTVADYSGSALSGSSHAAWTYDADND